MARLKFNIVLFLFLIRASQPLFAQNDTLKVTGPNLQDLSQYITYWVDSTQTGSLKYALKQLEEGNFKQWEPATTLNLGTNPYPLWWHLRVQQTGNSPQDYWWSIYTQADSLFVYRLIDSLWLPTDTLVYKTHLDNKKIRTRFPVIPVSLDTGETQQLFVKIINRRHTQNAFTDFTTPAHNLLWEKRFYMKVGFFLGAFLLFAVVSLILFFFMEMRAYLFFSGYLICIVVMMLHEELLLTVASEKWVYLLIKDIHPLPLSLVALGLHYLAIVFLLDVKRYSNVWVRISKNINLVIFNFGLVALLLFAFLPEQMTFKNPFFLLIWNLCIVLVFIMLINTFFIFGYLMHLKKKGIVGLVLGLLLVYFNAAGYFLNYAGILKYYTITYPNYFYWIVSLEFILLGIFLAWRYNKTLSQNMKLLREKAKNQEISHLRTVSLLEEERRQIARNLHDDLGTTINAVKLIVSNHYRSDVQLYQMVQRAAEQVRSFYKKIVATNDYALSLNELLKLKTTEAEQLSDIRIDYIFSGKEPVLDQPLKDSLMRIATELLSNLVKHSKAKTATLQFIAHPDQLQLLIEDDGVGFNTQKQTNSMGIHNIYSRAERWGGNVNFYSNGKGTTCIVNIPLNKTPNL